MVSAAPYVHLLLDGAYVGVRLMTNLSQPFGFGFDTGGVWSLGFEGGATF